MTAWRGLKVCFCHSFGNPWDLWFYHYGNQILPRTNGEPQNKQQQRESSSFVQTGCILSHLCTRCYSLCVLLVRSRRTIKINVSLIKAETQSWKGETNNSKPVRPSSLLPRNKPECCLLPVDRVVSGYSARPSLKSIKPDSLRSQSFNPWCVHLVSTFCARQRGYRSPRRCCFTIISRPPFPPPPLAVAYPPRCTKPDSVHGPLNPPGRVFQEQEPRWTGSCRARSLMVRFPAIFTNAPGLPPCLHWYFLCGGIKIQMEQLRFQTTLNSSVCSVSDTQWHHDGLFSPHESNSGRFSCPVTCLFMEPEGWKSSKVKSSSWK